MAGFTLTNSETGWDEGSDYGSKVPPQVLVAFDAECTECKKKFHATRLLVHGRPHDANVPPARFVLLPASAAKITCATRGCQTNVLIPLSFE
jgi:hypothetical protein